MAPTGNQLPPHICQMMKALLDDGLSPARVCGRVGVSKKTVERIRLNYELFGAPYPPPAVALGRPRALTYAQELWVLDFVADRSTTYLDEVALAVEDVFDISVETKTIRRILTRHQITQKVVKAYTAARSDQLRADWRDICWELPADKLCFIDESATNTRTGYRNRGWSRAGMSCVELRKMGRKERYSILPALTINGYLDRPFIINGGVTKEDFVWWLINVVVPQLEEGFIIVMDNASIHLDLGEEFSQAIMARGIRVMELPPYSPDFNPIENTFNTLKQWIKSNRAVQDLYEDFREFLVVAIASAIGQDARGYFRNCFLTV
jgi:transposase